MVGVWFPISMFIAIGFEHSVANMFILPAGLFSGQLVRKMGKITSQWLLKCRASLAVPRMLLSGAPLSWGDILVKNLIPVTIGNAIAGAFAACPATKGIAA